jgi:hypothetical protein
MAMPFLASRCGLDDFLTGTRREMLETTLSEQEAAFRSVATGLNVLEHAPLISVVSAQAN